MKFYAPFFVISLNGVASDTMRKFIGVKALWNIKIELTDSSLNC